MMARDSFSLADEIANILATRLPDAAEAQERADFGRGLKLLAALVRQIGELEAA